MSYIFTSSHNIPPPPQKQTTNNTHTKKKNFKCFSMAVCNSKSCTLRFITKICSWITSKALCFSFFSSRTETLAFFWYYISSSAYWVIIWSKQISKINHKIISNNLKPHSWNFAKWWLVFFQIPEAIIIFLYYLCCNE